MTKHLSRGVVLAVMAASACVLAASADARTAAAPTILGFAPSQVHNGGTVTIYGHDLGGAQVAFNGMPAMNVTVDAAGTHVKATVPATTMDVR